MMMMIIMIIVIMYVERDSITKGTGAPAALITVGNVEQVNLGGKAEDPSS
jgi:hypothetical protein